jgi:hypothetical protein
MSKHELYLEYLHNAEVARRRRAGVWWRRVLRRWLGPEPKRESWIDRLERAQNREARGVNE